MLFYFYYFFFNNSLKYNNNCNCNFPLLCDAAKNVINADNCLRHKSETKLELENVHKVYDDIANHFSETRHSPWPKVEQFVSNFLAGDTLIDIGCGNGKYLQLNDNINKVMKIVFTYSKIKMKEIN